MNFSQVIEEGGVAVELKYCERCGGLWLRALDDGESYCENCRAAMAAWPRIGRRKKNLHHGVYPSASLRATRKKDLNHGVHRGTRGNALSGGGYGVYEPRVIGTLLGVADVPGENGFTDVAEGRV